MTPLKLLAEASLDGELWRAERSRPSIHGVRFPALPASPWQGFPGRCQSLIDCLCSSRIFFAAGYGNITAGQKCALHHQLGRHGQALKFSLLEETCFFSRPGATHLLAEAHSQVEGFSSL